MTNPANTPKAVREALCAADSALGEQIRRGMNVDTNLSSMRQIRELIAVIDAHRPLGPDGVHGDRHTPTCGCEDHGRAPWSITLFPADHGDDQ